MQSIGNGGTTGATPPEDRNKSASNGQTTSTSSSLKGREVNPNPFAAGGAGDTNSHSGMQDRKVVDQSGSLTSASTSSASTLPQSHWQEALTKLLDPKAVPHHGVPRGEALAERGEAFRSLVAALPKQDRPAFLEALEKTRTSLAESATRLTALALMRRGFEAFYSSMSRAELQTELQRLQDVKTIPAEGVERQNTRDVRAQAWVAILRLIDDKK